MKRLKATLERRNMTYKELAFETGLHYNTIVKVPNSKRELSLTNAVKIADALEVSLDYLIGRANYEW